MFKQYFYKEEHKLIVRTATPLSIGFALQSFMSITEALVVAQSGTVALAAVSIAASLAGLLYLVTIGFVSASVPLIAKAVAKKQEQVAQVAVLSSLMIWTCSTVFGVLFLYFTVSFAHLLSIPADVVEGVVAWTVAVIFGFPAMCLFFWFRSIGTALGQTGFVGRVLAVTAATHLAALLFFAFDSPWSLGWGAFGAGVAHSIASWVALLGSVYSVFISPELKLRVTIPLTWRFTNLKRELMQHLLLGIPVTARIFLVEGFGYFLVLILPFLVTAVEISIHTIGLRVSAVTATLALGVSSAVAAHIGAARGRKTVIDVIAYSKSALEIGAAIGLLGFIFLLIIKPFLQEYLESDGVSISITFILMIAAYQAIVVIQSIATGALLGFEKTIVPLIATAIGSWCICLILIYITFLIGQVNILFIWACLVVGYFLSSTICILSLRKQVSLEKTRSPESNLT